MFGFHKSKSILAKYHRIKITGFLHKRIILFFTSIWSLFFFSGNRHMQYQYKWTTERMTIRTIHIINKILFIIKMCYVFGILFVLSKNFCLFPFQKVWFLRNDSQKTSKSTAYFWHFKLFNRFERKSVQPITFFLQI